MSNLDHDLAQAVADSEASDQPERPVVSDAQPSAASAPTTKRRNPKRNIGLLAALLVMGGGILTLVLTSFEDAAVYAKGVDELVAAKEDLASRNVRVEGILVKGSLKRREDPCEYRFKLQKNGETIDVRYAQCIVPDTFRDVPDVDVTVNAEGKLSEEGHFEAHTIMAKCPSKYEMKEQNKNGVGMPHQGAAPAAARGN